MNDTRAINPPVEATQDAPVPSVEQKAPEAGQVDPGAAPIESEATPQPQPSQGLPSDTSERTREQFEKLQERLREEREERIRLQSVFNTLQPSPQPTPQPQPLYDPDTGLLNEEVFNDIQMRAMQAEERAKRAESAVQAYQQNQIRGEDDRQRQEAIATYPELDSTSKSFDRNLHVQVRSILQDSLLHPEDYGTKTISYKEAADIARGVDKKIVDQAKQLGAQEAIEQLTPKEQASLEATGSPVRRNEVTTPLPDLRDRSRRGDLDAIVERLKKVPAVGRGQA